MMQAAEELIPLETLDDDEALPGLSEILIDERPVSLDYFDNEDLRRLIAEVLKTLSPREEKIVQMRFGIRDGSEHTLEEIGQRFSLTRERIRQIEVKALRKLRHPSRSRRLRLFLPCVETPDDEGERNNSEEPDDPE